MAMLQLYIVLLLPAIVSLKGGNSLIGNIHGERYETIELYCNDDKEVMAFEEEDDKKMVLGKSNGSRCIDGSRRCVRGSDDIFRHTDVTERKYVYDTCSYRPSCNVTSPDNTDALQYHYIMYAYSCLSKNRNLDISKDFNESIDDPLYLFLNTSSSSVSRVCSITSYLPLQVYSMYIVLSPESCRKIRIYAANQTLFSCGDGLLGAETTLGGEKEKENESVLIFNQMLNMSDEEINVTIDDYISSPGEQLWLKFKSEDGMINASCQEYIKPTTTPDLVTAVFNRTFPSMNVNSQLGYWIYIGAGMGVICVLLVLIIVCAVCGRDSDKKEGKTAKSNIIEPIRQSPPPSTNNNVKKKEVTLNPTYCDPFDLLTPQAATRLKAAGRPNASPEYQTISEIVAERELRSGREHQHMCGNLVSSRSGSDIEPGSGSGIPHVSGSDAASGSGSDISSVSGSEITSVSGSDVVSDCGSDLTKRVRSEKVKGFTVFRSSDQSDCFV